MEVLRLHMITRDGCVIHEVLDEQTGGSVKVSLWFKDTTKGLCDVTLACASGVLLTGQEHNYWSPPFDKEFWRMQYTFEGQNIQVKLYNLTSSTGSTTPLPGDGSNCTLSATGGNENIYITEFDRHKFKSSSYKAGNSDAIVVVNKV